MNNTTPHTPTVDADPKSDNTEAYLVLKKEFYDKIKEGKKSVEYRDFTKYWISRLLDHPLKTVKFNLGYSDEHMIFDIDWIGVMDGDKEIHAFNSKGEMNEAGKDDDFIPDTITIHLGKRRV